MNVLILLNKLCFTVGFDSKYEWKEVIISFDDNFVSLHLHTLLFSAGAGIKVKPCSLCTGKSGDSFIKSSAPTNSTEMPDSSYG